MPVATVYRAYLVHVYHICRACWDLPHQSAVMTAALAGCTCGPLLASGHSTMDTGGPRSVWYDSARVV